MKAGSTKKKRLIQLLVVVAIVMATVAILQGVHRFTHEEIRVVQAKYENGQDKEVWVYRKNIFGKQKKVKELTFFENGNKQSEVEYKRGMVNGWARMWYENGNLHLEGTYKNNRSHGVRRAYHENGQVFCKAKYHEGKLLGKENWDEEGNRIYLPLDRD
jgi:hypothetical protein